MIGDTAAARTPRQDRHAETRQRILDVTWELAEEVGIGAVSLREIARRVGMRQPSLYSYFASKDDLYDALFAQGNRELLEKVAALEPTGSPRQDLHQSAKALAEFCSTSPARWGLLFGRPIPGYEPSPEAYTFAQDFYTASVQRLHALGLREQRHMDMYVALVGGIITSQMTNEPGGDRWVRLLPEVIDMFLDHQLRASAPKKGRTK